jgi:hypothetical protein
MLKGYENFDLFLVWQPEGISVECRCPALGEFPSLETHSPPKPLSVSIPTTNTRFKILKDVGEKIAEVLLPEGEIRSLFRDWWKAGVKIRLRLMYPHPDIQEEEDRVKQIKEISSRPWEYVYLTRNEADQPDPEYLLGIREEISIVHCLRKPASTEARRTAVGRLPVSIRYISNLGGDDEDEKDIFNEFEQTVGVLEALIEYKAFDEPTRLNVVKGFIEDHLVHITCHGNLESLKIEPDEPFTQFEALKAFNHTPQPQVKGVILLSCSSNIGSGGLAAWLHRHTSVPAVIGMTGAILPDPSAKNFVKGFYRGLKRPSQGLERAIFLGRLCMYNQGIPLVGETLLESKWDPSFGLPRLFLNSPDSILIPEELLFGSDKMRKAFDEHISNLLSSIELPALNNDLNKISNWVDQPDKPWYFVVGREESEKSRLIAQLIDRVKRNKKHKIIYHFCRRGGSSLPGDPADPLAFIRHSLAPQLRANFVNYLPPEGRFPLLVGNKFQAIKDFVLGPLERIVNSGTEPPLIVIDDINFFRPGHGFENSILKLLSDQWDDLINVARFVIAVDMTNPIAQDELKKLLGEPDLRLLPENE